MSYLRWMTTHQCLSVRHKLCDIRKGRRTARDNHMNHRAIQGARLTAQRPNKTLPSYHHQTIIPPSRQIDTRPTDLDPTIIPPPRHKTRPQQSAGGESPGNISVRAPQQTTKPRLLFAKESGNKNKNTKPTTLFESWSSHS